MPALSRLVHLPASRRTYSSFFSSKPGGGRYFNSAKPPKTPVVTTTKKTQSESATSSSHDSQAKEAVDGASPLRSATPDPTQSSAPSSSAASASSPADGALADADAPLSSYAGVSQFYAQWHPTVNPKDFKLHQFFSLHRPLLLLSHPPAIMESAPANTVFSSSGPKALPQQQQQQPYSPSPIEDALGTSVDPDAEAARQLTRALTMNMAGATMAWEDTLRRLGLDIDQEPDRIGLQQQWDKEWEDVMMDSVKRKRKKKMKKHKLRKRRKLTRASRLKLK